MATMKAALQAKERVRELLKGLPGINGVGVTWDDEGRPCVRVNVDVAIGEEDRLKIPARVSGVPVLVEVTRDIHFE